MYFYNLTWPKIFWWGVNSVFLHLPAILCTISFLWNVNHHYSKSCMCLFKVSHLLTAPQAQGAFRRRRRRPGGWRGWGGGEGQPQHVQGAGEAAGSRARPRPRKYTLETRLCFPGPYSNTPSARHAAPATAAAVRRAAAPAAAWDNAGGLL